jgi:hypothetical protein
LDAAGKVRERWFGSRLENKPASRRIIPFSFGLPRSQSRLSAEKEVAKAENRDVAADLEVDGESPEEAKAVSPRTPRH